MRSWKIEGKTCQCGYPGRSNLILRRKETFPAVVKGHVIMKGSSKRLDLTVSFAGTEMGTGGIN
jgi:hypothetical protein